MEAGLLTVSMKYNTTILQIILIGFTISSMLVFASVPPSRLSSPDLHLFEDLEYVTLSNFMPYIVFHLALLLFPFTISSMSASVTDLVPGEWPHKTPPPKDLGYVTLPVFMPCICILLICFFLSFYFVTSCFEGAAVLRIQTSKAPYFMNAAQCWGYHGMQRGSREKFYVVGFSFDHDDDCNDKSNNHPYNLLEFIPLSSSQSHVIYHVTSLGVSR